MNSAPRPSLTRGAMLTVTMRWTDRLIGFVSLLILARLLNPDDIGLVAMATLVIALTDVFFDLGVNIALIQRRDATQADYNTAWTLRQLQGALAAGVIMASAPWAADYFAEPRVAAILPWLALATFVSGLENIGIVTFQKDMQFGAELRYLLTKRLFGFCLTVGLAVLLQSYWALVFGTLGGRLFGTVLSYLVHPMRPRWSMARFAAIFSVSQWMVLRSIGEFLHMNLHRLLVGRWSDSSTMGAYTMANEISTLPSAELVAPMNRAVFPAMAQAQDDPSELKRLYLNALAIQTVLALPAAVGLACVAPEAVTVVLGDKWRDTAPLLQLLALGSIGHILTSTGHYLLLATQRVKLAVATVWMQVGLFLLGLMLLGLDGGAMDVAMARVLGSVLGVFGVFALVLRLYAALSIAEVAGSIARPIVSASVMAIVLSTLPAWTPEASLLLLSKIAIGVAAYGASLLALWQLLGRPDGAEALLLKKIRMLRVRNDV